MRLQTNTTVQASGGDAYHFKADHRNGDRRKSQWLISLRSELICFETAIKSEWVGMNNAWGLHFSKNVPEVVGLSPEGLRVKIAKFVQSTPPPLWHGYPGDFRRRLQDRPPVGVLYAWVSLGIIRMNDARKVRNGARCILSG